MRWLSLSLSALNKMVDLGRVDASLGRCLKELEVRSRSAEA